ncbi:MAG: endo alpha-1,4 polygalactosaminidase [Candidatus Sericytochromatia bacterium]|nr:endo alpha-1,4 polygalactosaminidase [Candidatus Tanganyikabacteria bacterium]
MTGLLAWAGAFLCGARCHSADVGQWAVVYAPVPEPAVLAGYDVVALEPDHAPDLAALRKQGTRPLGYLSLGQIHRSRPYWEDARAAGILLDASPTWPDAWRVDPRSGLWRALVVNDLAPAITARGFQGFLLDTLDDAAALEHAGAAGAMAAMSDLVADLRRRQPGAFIVANGGLALLSSIAPHIDAVIVESVWTNYDFSSGAYLRRTAGEAALREALLRDVRDRYRLPVLPLEYAERDDEATRTWVREAASRAGFRPYVATISLDRLPEVAP